MIALKLFTLLVFWNVERVSGISKLICHMIINNNIVYLKLLILFLSLIIDH